VHESRLGDHALERRPKKVAMHGCLHRPRASGFDTGGIIDQAAGGIEDMKRPTWPAPPACRAPASVGGGARRGFQCPRARIGLVENMPAVKRNVPETSSPRCRDRRSRSSNTTPRAGWCLARCAALRQRRFKPEIHDPIWRHLTAPSSLRLGMSMPGCSPMMTSLAERLAEGRVVTGEASVATCARLRIRPRRSIPSSPT